MVDTYRSSCWMAKRWSGLVFLLALSACGSLPQPFRHEGESHPLTRPSLTRGVTVRPLDDAPQGEALARAMVKALEHREIPAAARSGDAFGHVIEGAFSPRGKVVDVAWILRAPDGENAATYRKEMSAAEWNNVDEPALDRLAEEAIGVLAQPLNQQAPEGTTPLDPTDRSLTVTLIPLRGLPGDGNKALTNAMRTALERSGILVRTEGSVYTIEGKVTIAPSLPGEDSVTLVWVVTRTKDKTSVGTIDQNGAVPRGHLSRTWGSIAQDMAEGGAVGVKDLLTKGQGSSTLAGAQGAEPPQRRKP